MNNKIKTIPITFLFLLNSCSVSLLNMNKDIDKLNIKIVALGFSIRITKPGNLSGLYSTSACLRAIWFKSIFSEPTILKSLIVSVIPGKYLANFSRLNSPNIGRFNPSLWESGADATSYKITQSEEKLSIGVNSKNGAGLNNQAPTPSFQCLI